MDYRFRLSKRHEKKAFKTIQKIRRLLLSRTPPDIILLLIIEIIFPGNIMNTFRE